MCFWDLAVYFMSTKAGRAAPMETGKKLLVEAHPSPNNGGNEKIRNNQARGYVSILRLPLKDSEF